jgi:opacity protein-like surface antigen
MNHLRLSLFSLLLLLLPRVVMAVYPEGSTGIALPSALGITIDGSRLGDADYDLSKPRSGVFPLTGKDGAISGRFVSQSTDLDDKGSHFSVVSVLLESRLTENPNDAFPLFCPTILAGLSYASLDVEDLGRNAAAGDDDATWILQFGAGVELRMSSAVTFDLRYRYLLPFERTLWLDGMPASIGIAPHNLLVGMRIDF